MLLKNNIPIGYVFGKIKTEVTVVTVYCIAVAIAYHYLHFTRISIPISVPSTMGTVLSLLLAFRSNQAYDRWWEARTLWGAIVNDSRSLARMIITYPSTEYNAYSVSRFQKIMIKRQIANM